MPRPTEKLIEEAKELFAAPGNPDLDRWCGIVAGFAEPPGRTGDIVAALDELAGTAPGIDTDPESVLHYVFTELGFRGNLQDYYNPDNSYLHRVLETRRGIPITLSIVAIEVGRRLGVGLTPVGFPSHFLIGDARRADRWFDPFDAGRTLDLAGCQELLERFYPGAPLQPGHTHVLRPAQLAHRMLNNLKHIHLAQGDLSRAVAVAQLAAELPEATNAHQVELVRLLTQTGRYAQAAELHDRLAAVDNDEADTHEAAARRLRANLN